MKVFLVTNYINEFEPWKVLKVLSSREAADQYLKEDEYNATKIIEFDVEGKIM